MCVCVCVSVYLEKIEKFSKTFPLFQHEILYAGNRMKNQIYYILFLQPVL